MSEDVLAALSRWARGARGARLEQGNPIAHRLTIPRWFQRARTREGMCGFLRVERAERALRDDRHKSGRTRLLVGPGSGTRGVEAPQVPSTGRGGPGRCCWPPLLWKRLACTGTECAVFERASSYRIECRVTARQRCTITITTITITTIVITTPAAAAAAACSGRRHGRAQEADDEGQAIAVHHLGDVGGAHGELHEAVEEVVDGATLPPRVARHLPAPRPTAALVDVLAEMDQRRPHQCLVPPMNTRRPVREGLAPRQRLHQRPRPRAQGDHVLLAARQPQPGGARIIPEARDARGADPERRADVIADGGRVEVGRDGGARDDLARVAVAEVHRGRCAVCRSVVYE